MAKIRLLKTLFGSKQTYCIPISDYPKTFMNLAKSIKAPDLDTAYKKIKVSCDRCGFYLNRQALNTLLIGGPGAVYSGREIIPLGGEKGGDDLISGKCPECGHSQIKIVIKEQ